MKFYEDGIFHIYNQGNSKKEIFLNDANYEYFLWKMKAFLLPFGDLISYSLMPNHFHWLFFVKYVEIPRKDFRVRFDKIEAERRKVQYGKKSMKIKRPLDYYRDSDHVISLNQSIGKLLGSYARSFNEAYGLSGSLFRKRCKAKDGMLATFDHHDSDEMGFGSDYVSRCFFYIHENAKVAGLVKENAQYPWSSALDYETLNEGSICNLSLGLELTQSDFK